MPNKQVVAVPGGSALSPNLVVVDDDATPADVTAAIAAHNADPTAHGGMLMPAFISETYQVLAGGGGAASTVAIPVNAKHFAVYIRSSGVCVATDLEVSLGHTAPPDVGPQFPSAPPLMMNFGVLLEIPAHCAGGEVPDTIGYKNNAVLGAGNDIEVWTRLYT